MRDGFIKVGAASPKNRVADVKYNVDNIKKSILEAYDKRVKILVFPELSLTSYTLADLFYYDSILSAALDGLKDIASYTAEINTDTLVFVGLPLRHGNKLYNVAAAISQGKILGFVPKTHLLNRGEGYEKRWFSPAFDNQKAVEINGESIPFAKNLIFAAEGLDLKIGVEIGSDLFAVNPPSTVLATCGANLIVNLAATSEGVGKAEYRKNTILSQSKRLNCAYLYADAGSGESTTDVVYSGHRLIAENGKMLEESPLFSYGLTISEIDIKLLTSEKIANDSFVEDPVCHQNIRFWLKEENTHITRRYSRLPFIISGTEEMEKRAELILNIQAQALKKRLEHTRSQLAVVGISGGLDSALALLVIARTKKLMEKLDILAITMPCFGTTGRTLDNAKLLTKQLGGKLQKISIKTAVNRHLLDIKQDKNTFDVAFENAQARERTQILMDIANSKGGLVVGTGDLSEVALGWSTYNGDHMSMYGVNCTIPKTLVQYLVAYEAYRLGGKAKSTLLDILDTPISPELLPTDGTTMTQKTEDKIGPYELHDFFLYYFIRYRFSTSKILRLATIAFDGIYEKSIIQKWLKVFVKRFFSQQFKRSCMPDGVKVGSVALSPRGDLKMPSDAVALEWLNDIE